MSYSLSAYPALQEKRVVPDTASTSQLHTFKNFLLDFSNTIADPLWFCGIESDEAGTVVKNISEHMLRLAPESKLDNATLEKSTSAIMLCAKLKTWARSLELSNGGGCERWRLFYKTNFIAELEYAVNTGVNGELTPGPSSPPSQDDLYEFLKYSAPHFFEDAHKVYKSDNADSAAQDARVYVSFAADDLPAFKSVPVQQLASWKHLLQVNIFDTYFETTAKHLAELGFEAALPLPTTKVQSKEPESVLFPFFVSGCDGHLETCGANYSAQTRPSYNTIVHSSPLSTGVTCATALAMLGQLERISIDDDEEPLFATQPPGIVAMTFVEKHVGVWVVHRIEHRDIYRAGICIWSGDMTKLRDVVELTVIFNKIASWATTTFRSWISDRVAQWISRFSSAPTEGEDDDQLEALGIQIGKLRISRTNSFGVNRRN